MADDDEKMKKMRIRIERDAYSVLVSFKDGATPAQLEKRMDETLGYTYAGKYRLAGVSDMGHLMRESTKIRQLGDGKFKVIATEEVSDLVALIQKQKDGGKKKRGKGQRAATSVGFRNGFSGNVSLRSSPKGMNGYRSMNARPNFGKSQYATQPSQARPNSSAALNRNFGSGAFSVNHNYTFNANAHQNYQNRPKPSRAPSALPTYPQRPLARPGVTLSSSQFSFTTTQPMSSSSSRFISAPSPAPSIERVTQQNETVKPGTKACQMPSIKEFSDNSKQMMLKMYPRTVHLSEMTEVYNQEYGVVVDPLQLFSKSWIMLVRTTFKDWLELADGQVKLKDEWAKKNQGLSFTQFKRPLVPIIPTIKEVPEPLPGLPVLRIQQPTTPSFSKPNLQGFRYQEPKALKSPDLVQKMQGLTVGARNALPTPEKPPGVSRETKPPVNNFRVNPFLRPKTALFPTASPKPKYPGMRPLTASARNHNLPMPARNTTLESAALGVSPSSSSDAPPSQPSSVSPPLATPTRMRLVQPSAPSARLFELARADVKKQGNETTVSHHCESSANNRYAPTTSTMTSKNEQLIPTVPVEDEWTEPAVAIKIQEGRALSTVGHGPMLPPMSKGAPSLPKRSTRSTATSQKSACSTRASSIERAHLKDAVHCDLPESDENEWD